MTLRSLLRSFNKMINRKFHRYFTTEACLQAVLADTLLHRTIEEYFGLDRREIDRRTQRYLPMALEKCLNTYLSKHDAKIELKPRVRVVVKLPKD